MSALSVISWVAATAIMLFGVGTTFLPSSTRDEAGEVWLYFFSAWSVTIILLALSRVLTAKSRGLWLVFQWTDVVVDAQAMICLGYVIWGISLRLQGH